MGEARGCAVHPAGDGSRDQCGDVTDRDGQILGIGSRKQAAASGRASLLSHVLSPCVPVFRVRTPHLACRSLLSSRGTWGDETPNLFWTRIAASWIPFIERLPEVHAAFLVCGCDGWKAGGCPLRNWVTQSQGCVCRTDWRSQGCHGLTWDSRVSSKPWPRPSLRWAGPGKCADLPWTVTSLESARVSVFLLCFVRAQWFWELSLGRYVGKELWPKSGVGAGKWEGGNCRKKWFFEILMTCSKC